MARGHPRARTRGGRGGIPRAAGGPDRPRRRARPVDAGLGTVTRAVVAFAALATGAIWVLGSGGSGAAAPGCGYDGKVATVTLEGPAQVTVGVGADGGGVVNGEPCAAAGGASEIRVVGAAGSQSGEI